MIVSYLVSKLALSDSKDFISKNFVKLLIINIILRGFPFAVLIIGSLYFFSTLDALKTMLDVSKISYILSTLFLVYSMLFVFQIIIDYIYEKSIVYFIARKENDKYRTFLKWAILDTSIIKSIKSFIGYILIVVLYGIMFAILFMASILASPLLSIFVSLFLSSGPIVAVILLFVSSIIFEIILLFISLLKSYTSKSYFFARASNPSNWSSLKMAFSSISRKVIKGILKLILYVLIITIILFAILLAMGFVIGLLNLNLNLIIILFVIIGIYLLTEYIAYNVISDLYILNMIKTNSQSEMGQNAEQSK
jgi:hypothetical protein